MKITFLSDNKTERAGCAAEWGLSVLIESRGRKVLFDVGASPVFAENAKALGIDLSEVDSVVISHGHYDHTEGMATFCDINDKAPIYIHEDAVAPAYGTDRQGNIEKENCGIRWDEDLIEKVKARAVFTRGVVRINENMVVAGDISPSVPATEKFYRIVGGAYRRDSMNHEQILIVKEEKGIYLFSGCSHTGIMSAIEKARQLFPEEKLVAVAAGMHLYPLSRGEKQKVVDSICDTGAEYVFPVHCTGMTAIMMFKEKMGKRCIIASAGGTYEC